MNEIFKLTISSSLKVQNIVPITLDVEHVSKGIEEIFSKRITPTLLQEYSDAIEQWNQFVIHILQTSIDQLESYLFTNWYISRKFINVSVTQQLHCEIQQLNKINGFLAGQFRETNRETEITEQLIRKYQQIEESIHELIDNIISSLNDGFMSLDNIQKVLIDIIDTQLERVAYDLIDFCYISISEHLLISIKNLMIKIAKQFFGYLMKVSFYANQRMINLNTLLEQYPQLANCETYQYIQREVSDLILAYSINLLQFTCFDRYPLLQDKIAMSAIKYFYCLMDISIKWFNYEKQSTFKELIEQEDFKLIFPQFQFIQIMEVEEDSNQINLLEQFQNVQVIQYHKINTQYKIIIVCENQQENFIITRIGNYIYFHKFFQYLTINMEPIDINMNFDEFIDTQFQDIKQNVVLLQSQLDKEQIVQYDEDDEYYAKYRKYNYKAVSMRIPKKPSTFKAKSNVIGVRAIAAGLGIFIIQCLDDEIPWNIKLKNAGYTSLQVSIIGFVSSRLPMIGLVIQQVLLFFAVRTVLSNKVISDLETTKNFGQVFLQTSMILGITLGGSLILPLGLWGVFLSGLIAGVSIGLYQKFIIPLCMDNLMEMVDKASILIRKNGVVRYKPCSLKILKLDEKFIKTRKPKNLSDDAYFTLLMFCLINEIRLICQVYYQSDLERLSKIKDQNKNQLKADLLRRQVQREVLLQRWNICYLYLRQEKISLIENIQSCSEFIEGMLSNYIIK